MSLVRKVVKKGARNRPPGKNIRRKNHGWSKSSGRAGIKGSAARIQSPVNKKSHNEARRSPVRTKLTPSNGRLLRMKYFIRPSFLRLRRDCLFFRLGFEGVENIQHAGLFLFCGGSC